MSGRTFKECGIARGLGRRCLALLRGDEGREEGQVLLFFLVCLPLIFMLVVLVVDGGRMYLEYIRARNAAELAAQAGAQAVDENVFRNINEVKLNIDGSLYGMQRMIAMNSQGRQGQILTTYHGDTAFARVCTSTEVESYFGRLFGIDTMRVGACARAYPAFGIIVEGQ